MKKTLLEQFKYYICNIHSLHSKWSLQCKFEWLFVYSLFMESKKRRMNEGHNDLPFDAALSMIEENCEDFEKYMHQCGEPFYFFYGIKERYESMAREIANQLQQSVIVKNGIEQWLCDFRKDIFEEQLYKQNIRDIAEKNNLEHKFNNEYIFEEHPMQTFVYHLDYIENLKGTAEYKKWFDVKRSLVNLIRVGNAILKRSEWKSKVTEMGGSRHGNE